MDDESTRTAISQALEVDHQYHEMVLSRDQERIDQIRRLGRAIGRERSWRVRTFARDHDARTSVWVVVTEGDPADEERIRERSHLLLEEAFKELLPPAES